MPKSNPEAFNFLMPGWHLGVPVKLELYTSVFLPLQK